uniref:hypothetical protein n=1 Tax=Salmonella sp. TaxID=599 RepID=UPI001CD9AF34|nr:hypothetical protein [Salmonella sp.]
MTLSHQWQNADGEACARLKQKMWHFKGKRQMLNLCLKTAQDFKLRYSIMATTHLGGCVVAAVLLNIKH